MLVKDEDGVSVPEFPELDNYFFSRLDINHALSKSQSFRSCGVEILCVDDRIDTADSVRSQHFMTDNSVAFTYLNCKG